MPSGISYEPLRISRWFLLYVDLIACVKCQEDKAKGILLKKTKLVLAGLVSANFLKRGLCKNIQTDPRWNHNPVADLQHAINLLSPANTLSWLKKKKGKFITRWNFCNLKTVRNPMLYIIILLKYIILDVRKISRKEAKKYGQSLLKKTVAPVATGRYLVPNSDMQPVILRWHVQPVSHYNTRERFQLLQWQLKHFSLRWVSFLCQGRHTTYATKSKSANVRTGLQSYGVWRSAMWNTPAPSVFKKTNKYL